VPGIFVVSPRLSLNELIAELDLICRASEPHEYRDGLHYLPVSG
jgi:hypothetical protein